jgi:hypothetical protein
MTHRAAKGYRGVPITVVTKPNAQHDEVEDLEDKVRNAFPGADSITVARDRSGSTVGFAEWVSRKAL